MSKKAEKPVQQYEVRAGHSIFIASGEKAVGGDLVELSRAEAKPFLARECIKVHMADDAADDAADDGE